MTSFSMIVLSSPIVDSNVFEQFYLSIGAGIWEEFLFRYTFINFLFFFTSLFTVYSKFFKLSISILISALLFSIFHYIGSYGDIFAWNTFLLRFFAGIFLGCLFLFRGLGISAYTHIIYDMFIVSFPILKIIK